MKLARQPFQLARTLIARRSWRIRSAVSETPPGNGLAARHLWSRLSLRWRRALPRLAPVSTTVHRWSNVYLQQVRLGTTCLNRESTPSVWHYHLSNQLTINSVRSSWSVGASHQSVQAFVATAAKRWKRSRQDLFHMRPPSGDGAYESTSSVNRWTLAASSSTFGRTAHANAQQVQPAPQPQAAQFLVTYETNRITTKVSRSDLVMRGYSSETSRAAALGHRRGGPRVTVPNDYRRSQVPSGTSSALPQRVSPIATDYRSPRMDVRPRVNVQHTLEQRQLELVWRSPFDSQANARENATTEDVSQSRPSAHASSTRPMQSSATQLDSTARQSSKQFVLDAQQIDRLTDDILRRVEKKMRIERERRGLGG